MVTGGEDSKINSWPIHPVELEADEDIDIDNADEDESMDVDDIPSPRARKRERSGEKELVCLLNASLDSILIDVIARKKGQTLTMIIGFGAYNSRFIMVGSHDSLSYETMCRSI